MGFFDKLKSIFSKKAASVPGPVPKSKQHTAPPQPAKQATDAGQISQKDAPQPTHLRRDALAERDYQYETAADGGVIITKFPGDWSARGVRIPDTLGGRPVTEIGKLAFVEIYNGNPDEEINELYCDGVVEHEVLYLPNTIHTIGDCAFAMSRNVHSLHFPSELKTIGRGSFYENNWGAFTPTVA